MSKDIQLDNMYNDNLMFMWSKIWKESNLM